MKTGSAKFHRWGAVIFFSVVLGGCSSLTSQLRVSVSSPASPCGENNSDANPSPQPGGPVEGASIYFDCPTVIHPERVRLGTTDSRGEFFYREWMGINIHDGCELWVEKDGYEVRHFNVHDVCSRFIDDLAKHCEDIVLNVDLCPLKTDAAPHSSDRSQ